MKNQEEFRIFSHKNKNEEQEPLSIANYQIYGEGRIRQKKG